MAIGAVHADPLETRIVFVWVFGYTHQLVQNPYVFHLSSSDMSSSDDPLNPKGRDIDLRWIFGNLSLWFGAAIIVFSFVDLFNGESLKLWSYIIAIALIIVGIFLMKKSRNSAPIGEAYKAGMIYRGFRGRI